MDSLPTTCCKASRNVCLSFGWLRFQGNVAAFEWLVVGKCMPSCYSLHNQWSHTPLLAWRDSEVTSFDWSGLFRLNSSCCNTRSVALFSAMRYGFDRRGSESWLRFCSRWWSSSMFSLTGKAFWWLDAWNSSLLSRRNSPGAPVMFRRLFQSVVWRYVTALARPYWPSNSPSQLTLSEWIQIRCDRRLTEFSLRETLSSAQ